MSDTAAPAVALRNVSKLFDGHAAVDNASFTLEKGSFLTILGPSGCGKTTLLRMIAGFIQPTSGEIEIEGRPVSAVPPHRRAIGMVFQKLALFPHMTAAQNIAYPLKMRRFDPKRIPGLVEQYLEVVRLEGHGDRRIFELSGGQQQRVAIARAQLQPRPASSGRAALGARPQAARGDAARIPPHPAGSRCHHHQRDP